MKNFSKMFMMLCLMMGALCLASCGGDDDENDNGNGNGGGIDDSRDFIEVTVNGHKYSHKMVGIYAELPLDDGLILTSTTEDIFYEDGFSFFFSLAHYENSSKLLSSSLGSHSIRNSWYYDGATNLCFYPIYKVGKKEYELVSGSHEVTSLRKTSKGAQVQGNFNAKMDYDGETITVKGNYSITVN